MNEIQLPWIRVGYEIFAREGPAGLKVERIAKRVNKAKSSFYHHFADLEIFTSFLLAYHLEQAHLIAEKEAQCTNVVPELLHVLLEHKIDLLFNRQLRVNRQVPEFERCFEATSQEVGEAILGIWAEALGLEDNSRLAMMVLKLTLENFYLQITEETLTYEWLEQYIRQLQAMGGEINKGKTRDLPVG